MPPKRKFNKTIETQNEIIPLSLHWKLLGSIDPELRKTMSDNKSEKIINQSNNKEIKISK